MTEEGVAAAVVAATGRLLLNNQACSLAVVAAKAGVPEAIVDCVSRRLVIGVVTDHGDHRGRINPHG